MKTRTTVAIVVGAAALVLGGGGVAVAETTHTTGGHGHRGHGFRLGHVEHGQFVTKDRSGQQVTHDVAKGTVASVSATAISVKSPDGVTTAFSVSSQTKVHVKGHAKGTTTAVTSLKTGQQVEVLGTGATGPFAATHIRAT